MSSDGGGGRTGVWRQRAARERLVVSWTAAVGCTMAAAGLVVQLIHPQGKQSSLVLVDSMATIGCDFFC